MLKADKRVIVDSVGRAPIPTKILVVDDDPIFRRVTGAYLEKQGYRVYQADNGLSALEQLRAHVPDLVLCDLAMPILDGIEFAEEVSIQYPSLPLIVVSATDEMSDVAKALRYGIKDFLAKPITDFRHLSEAIESTLRETFDNNANPRDFASEWFRVDGGGEMPDEQELHWHLQYLQQHPNAARDLLRALAPERESQLGSWQCSYRLLQPADIMPLVFDYRWLASGQYLFYLVDSNSAKGDAAATSLLIRALFDDYVRHLRSGAADLRELLDVIEKGMHCSESAGQVNALIGVGDLPRGTMAMLPAGLDSQWSVGDQRQVISGGYALGDGCLDNPIYTELELGSKAILSLSDVGQTNFALTIRQTETPS
ncbi:response regulator [Vibrio sp. SM6]|uniref:Response regulator n=1 Tax=Vibrio agarilyticus TaxID=2726741 RepID=A0A7X8TR79_9VIBR|nr:response regulator [Vibrio agarilyticus]NLS13289.1 response regulator [Vibrio agarilyticus]